MVFYLVDVDEIGLEGYIRHNTSFASKGLRS